MSATAEHVCSPSLNPRRENYCDCGRALPRGLMRDPRFEGEIVRQLCDGLKIDWERLHVYASRRADIAKRDYGRDFPDIANRNMAIEGADENGDAVNYARWWLDAFNRGLIPDSEHWKCEHFERALKFHARRETSP